MTHPLEAIVALQKKDLRLIRLLREVQDIPKRKDDIEQQVNGFKRKLEETSEQRKKIEVKINELENDKRGIYSGAVGYYDFCGNLNTCIAIRTFVMKDDKVFFQAGAGIVHDSDPEKEFNETIHKAKALMKALDLAEDGLIQ